MGRKKISPSEKLQAVQEYLAGKGSKKAIASKYGITCTPFGKWLAKYEAFGPGGFIRTGHNASYTSSFKKNVVRAYLEGEGSYRDLAIKYKIPDENTVRRWVMKYNGHDKLKSTGTGGAAIMTKGRTTTFEERIEIVEYCIEHNHSYAETSQKYQVSYQQARSYTLKYESGGAEALKDNRGKRKSEKDMTEEEILRAENRILKAKIKQAEMEVSFLKKLEEIERRRG